MQFQTPYMFAHAQPRPRFCIFRPGGLLAPLIPVDELPAWLQVCNWSPDTFMGLQPVSLSYIPREGEYDVICHHCSSSVDSLHQSISERNEDSPQSSGSQTKSCPGVFFKPTGDYDLSLAGPKVPPGFPLTSLGQPSFHSGVQNPFLGYYMFGMPNVSSNPVTAPVASHKPLSVVRSSSSDENSLVAGIQPSQRVSPPPRLDTPATSIDPQDVPVPCSAGIPSSNPDPGGDIRELPSLGPTEMKIAAAIAASLCSIAHTNESIASERSLTAAVEQLKKRQKKPVSRGPSLQKSTTSQSKPKPRSRASSRGSKVHRVHSAARRRARVRRRRRANKPRQSEQASPTTKDPVQDDKPEQVNSSTKRRERREKMAKGRREQEAKSRYWHEMIPSWSSTVPHR
ncbi:uncharacterized protein N7459_000360 [Penicillium hispanicum]|uniref:uncharacterized protein n=1 Tax=Penicillium hispanicum TaxID=1080232 RepID=UPI0025425CE8|nr:uncharacterized protein N7459_000360 [Penicillium hispanicum]KAJ5594152.1 hypothetical protein N7459_000360 [Penicillium hispanicum]